MYNDIIFSYFVDNNKNNQHIIICVMSLEQKEIYEHG